jgi:glycerate kinase
MKFLIVPDKFKGGMTAETFCAVAKKALDGKAEARAFPACDGGEGTVENLTSLAEGRIVGDKVSDGNFFVRVATYGVHGDTAYISVSNSSGLQKTMIKDPEYTTTYGFGEQIAHAMKLGGKNFILALGGSSSNDGGAGAACALGAKFFNGGGEEFIPSGGTLKDIASVDISGLRKNVAGAHFTALCDVKNPLLGADGCSRSYAPQKGAGNEAVIRLEENMRAYAEKTSFLGVEPSEMKTGAAGGLGYFVKAFLCGELVSGADFFLDTVGFEKEAADADFVVTGEGCFDGTSGEGKICGEVIERAKKLGKKVVVFCGESRVPETDGVKIVELNDKKVSLAENVAATEEKFFTAFGNFVGEAING